MTYLVSAAISGSVATDTETDKCRQYNHHDLLNNYYFQPVAIETTGVYSKPTTPFLNCLAKKVVDIDFRQPQGATVAPATSV